MAPKRGKSRRKQRPLSVIPEHPQSRDPSELRRSLLFEPAPRNLEVRPRKNVLVPSGHRRYLHAPHHPLCILTNINAGPLSAIGR